MASDTTKGTGEEEGEMGPDRAGIDLLLKEGAELLSKGQVNSACARATEALMLRPGNPLAQNLLGLGLLQQGHALRALETFEKLVRRNPEEVSLRLNAGLAALRTDDLSRSLEHLRRAVDLDPDHSRAFGYLALVHLRSGEGNLARAALREAGLESLADQIDEVTGAEGLARRAVELETVVDSLPSTEPAVQAHEGFAEAASIPPSRIITGTGRAIASGEIEIDAEPPKLKHRLKPAPTTNDAAKAEIKSKIQTKIEIETKTDSPKELEIEAEPPSVALLVPKATEPVSEPKDQPTLEIVDEEEAASTPEVTMEPSVKLAEEAIAAALAETAVDQVQPDTEEEEEEEEEESEDLDLDLDIDIDVETTTATESATETETETETEAPAETEAEPAADNGAEPEPATTVEAEAGPDDEGLVVESITEDEIATIAEYIAEGQVEAETEPGPAIEPEPELEPEEELEAAPVHETGGAAEPSGEIEIVAEPAAPGESVALIEHESAPREVVEESDGVSALEVDLDQTSPTAEIWQGGLLLRLNEELFDKYLVQRDYLLLMRGDLSMQEASRRRKGADAGPFVVDGQPMMEMAGRGMMLLHPGPHGRFHLVKLHRAGIYLREQDLVALSGQVSWENGRIPETGLDGPAIVNLWGSGYVAFRGQSQLWRLQAGPARPPTLPFDCLAAWSSGVVPQVVDRLGDRLLISFNGEGTLWLGRPEPQRG
jgi:tetratricopeptide (TPR) repeat protein/uncharacterized protein (AIM24 family)